MPVSNMAGSNDMYISSDPELTKRVKDILDHPENEALYQRLIETYKNVPFGDGMVTSLQEVLDVYHNAKDRMAILKKIEDDAKLAAAKFSSTSGANLDLATIGFDSFYNYVTLLGSQLEDFMHVVEEGNQQLAKKQSELNGLRAEKAKALAGASEKDKAAIASDWDDKIAKVDAEVQNKSSQSQLDMVKLQSMLNKYNLGVELLSQFVAKLFGTSEKVVNNMR